MGARHPLPANCGEREETEFAARAGSISHERGLVGRQGTQVRERTLELRLLFSIARPLSSESAFAWRLAIFYAALFVALGVQFPFLPLWLPANGLDAGAIGIALALPMAIVIAAGMAVLGYGAVGMAQGAAVITIALALASVFYTPIMPLADAYALRGLGRLRRAYGPVRLWGSAAFIVGSFGAGLLLDLIPARELIWLIVAALTITA